MHSVKFLRKITALLTKTLNWEVENDITPYNLPDYVVLQHTRQTLLYIIHSLAI
jgi:hypothetical protein